jgi:hypothetical protein
MWAEVVPRTMGISPRAQALMSDAAAAGNLPTAMRPIGALKPPRVYDSSGLPLHLDNESIFKERFYLDKADPNVLHDEMTTIDHALTRPWTVDKRYRRTPNAPTQWSEYYCGENNAQIVIGDEHYFVANGMLAPVRKGQKPPDLRYFEQPARLNSR